MKYIIMVALSLLAVCAHCQQDSSLKKVRPFYVKFVPTEMLNPIAPRFTFGLEYRFAKAVSVNVDLGINTPYHFESSDKLRNYESYRAVAELRYYFGNRERTNIDWYMATEFSFTRNSYNRYNSYFKTFNGIEDVATEYRVAKLNKNIFGAAFKIGLQHHLDSRIALDWFLGLGFRSLNNTITAEVLNTSGFVNAPPMTEDSVNGKLSTVYVPMGLRLCYRIK